MARENPYDAIVLDIMLPGMNGYQVCATLREEGDWTPILMLTAKDGEFDEAEALDTGADDYLTKPFSFVVLVAGCGRCSAAAPGSGRRSWRPATSGSTRASGGPGGARSRFRLTAREIALLEFLLRHRGEVVSKAEILDHVWDYDFDGDPNIVEVYVGQLRDKLDRPFGRDAIETVRGSGYRLAADGG